MISMNRGEVTIAIMEDFSKAFDTVVCETFLCKLLKLGAFALYSVSLTNALDLLNFSPSSTFQAALLFFLRSSDMYAYFALQLF